MLGSKKVVCLTDCVIKNVFTKRSSLGQKNIISKLFNTVKKKLGDTIFVGFENHSKVKNHKLIVLKNIVTLYAKTRMNHFARTHCWTVKKRIRKKMSKLILFKNQ